jgi:hypothetical protein
MDLDDILKGDEPEQAPMPEAEAEQAPLEAVAAPAQPRDEHGRFAPKGETEPAEAQEPAEAAPPAAESIHQVPPAALIEERRKRQELERQLAEYQQRYQPQPQPQYASAPQQGSNVPVVFDDEYAQSIFEQAVSYVRQELTPQIQGVAGGSAVEIQREVLRMRHEDYDEVERTFLDMARNNPALQDAFNKQPRPVEWAYNYVKKAQEVEKIGSLDMAQLEAGIRAKVLAELQTQAQGTLQANLPPAVPPSLSSQRNVGSRAGPAWAGPTPLGDILNRT